MGRLRFQRCCQNAPSVATRAGSAGRRPLACASTPRPAHPTAGCPTGGVGLVYVTKLLVPGVRVRSYASQNPQWADGGEVSTARRRRVLTSSTTR